MPQNKKHHYVPRFYLKRFSPDGKSINVWNISRELKILSGNLKNQCYKNYFYGKEADVENVLGDIESKISEIFRSIDKYETLPSYGNPDNLILVLYILLQYGRTAYSADVLDEMSDKMMKHLYGPQIEDEGIDLSGIKIGIKDPARYSLGVTVQALPLILDLHCKLLINDNTVEFVTSDNPVVLYNQLFSFRRYGSNTGIASKGLQIFFPISPKKQLIFYDSVVYSVGNRNRSVVKITDPRDIYELNTLQMCSAAENLYFHDETIDIEALNKKSQPFRRMQKSNFEVFSGYETEERRQEFIASSREDVRTNLKLSFLRMTVVTKKWRAKFLKLREQPAVVVRNEDLCKNHSSFMKKVDAKEYNPGDFFKGGGRLEPPARISHIIRKHSTRFR